MAITAATRQDIIELVVTALNAAPGTTLLNELVAIVDGGGTLADVAANLAASDTFTARYPAFQTAEEFAAEWLGNLIPEAGADALAEAKALVVAAVNGGTTAASLILQAQEFLSAASETDAAFGTSAANFNNKAEVASHQTLTNETAGLDTTALNSVTSDDATVTTATAALDAVANAIPAQSFTLTKNVDSSTLGAGDDSFSSTNTATVTLNGGDVIDGGAGTDTLSISNTAANAALGNGATVSNVEKVYVNAVAATTLDTALMTGITNVYNNGSLADLTVSGLKAIPAVHLLSTSNNTTATMAATAVAGTADEMTVELSGAAVTSSANLTAEGIETFNVIASSDSGSATNSQTLTSANAHTVVVTGDADSNITVSLAGATATQTGTFTGNAGANRVNVTVDAADVVAVDLGAGNDTYTASSIGAKHTVAGGEGEDTLKLTQAVASAASASATVSGWETLNVSDAGTGTVDMDAFSGVTKVVYDAGLGGATTVDDAVTGIEVEVDVTATAQNLTVDLKTDGAADAITVTLDAIGVGDNIGTINASDAESLTINVDDDTTTATGTIGITSITLGDATSVTISGDAATTISGATNPTTAVLATVNAGGMTDNLTVSGMNYAAAGATVTLGSGNDTLTLGTADGADTIDISAGGKDKIVYTALGQSDAAGTDTIVGFVSGTDDIDLTGLAGRNITTSTQFGGVGATKTIAEGKLGGTNSAVVVFQADENLLWVDVDANGVLNASDFRVKLEGVSTIAATDLALSTSGASITADTTATTSITTAAVTGASAKSTNESDTVTGTLAALNGGTVDMAGGAADALVVSDDITGAGTVHLTSAAGGSVLDINLDNAESVTFNGQTGLVDIGTNHNNENVTVNGDLGALTITLGANKQTVTVNNTQATNASTITFGAFTGQVATTGAADDIFNAAADGFTATGGAGADTFNITNVAVYDNDAVKAAFVGGVGTDSLVFANGLTVAVDFSDTSDITVSGIETLNIGTVGAASTANLTGTSFTTVTGNTTTGSITLTTDIASFDQITTLTNTAGTQVFDITFSDAGSIDLRSTVVDMSGGAGNVDVITLAAGANTVTIDSTGIGDIAGIMVAAGSDDTMIVTDTSTVTDNTFNAIDIVTIGGTTAIDVTDAALDVARTLNGNSANNTVVLTGGISAIKTVDISQGGTDTVSVAMDSASYATITGFTPGTGGDVLNLVNADDSAVDVSMSAPIATTGYTATTVATDADNGVVLAATATQISGALTATGDAGAVEAAIIAAGLIGINSNTDDDKYLVVALDNGTDTGVYRVQVNAGADTDFTDADDMDNVTLIAVLEGVTADQLVPANII